MVTLAADANGGLYVDGMRAHCLAVATSCLVQPLAGDRVCVIVDGDKLVITEILSRQQANAVMTLDSRCANLRIVAPEIELQGGKRLTLRSPHFTLLTRSSRWVAETLHKSLNACLCAASTQAGGWRKPTRCWRSTSFRMPDNPSSSTVKLVP